MFFNLMSEWIEATISLHDDSIDHLAIFYDTEVYESESFRDKFPTTQRHHLESNLMTVEEIYDLIELRKAKGIVSSNTALSRFKTINPILREIPPRNLVSFRYETFERFFLFPEESPFLKRANTQEFPYPYYNIQDVDKNDNLTKQPGEDKDI